MPLAKVIPIVNGLIYTILADTPNPFVQVIFFTFFNFVLFLAFLS